ncbi:UDP-3-O-(3-hydroxymyristoyl) glucosamine N-acyltransferase [Sulfurifustis variabilis]|uniref:UDP-3-O-acylglucosamine N-acyltransferase n=1 Tax=Sulfurifustis variabilis TaxID=1675686 RepID=A0A1B4V3Q9_9GAMM|nr:UDP-3-O-(3-hydroxymyristoyl)glucosamine N-acyltransferase [Sulfurifustis variabilis]BAU48186.1 UDP-3-O-(3-hydroxymyristoyl) glucosamine N-acyltransferase [Sulfurifustis variabilis]
MAVTLAELARRVGGQVRGDPGVEIRAVAPLDRAGPGEIAHLSDRRYRALVAETRAAAVVLVAEDAGAFKGTALIHPNPSLAFARIAAFLHPAPAVAPGRHPTAFVEDGARVADSARIGAYAVIEREATVEDGASIGPGCYVGQGARVGARTCLVAQVYVGARCEIGTDCLLQPGAVIGADGFGFAKDGERWIKVPQLGRVIVGDDVEIGANTTVDRGTLDDTVIARGVKLDNLIQIAHNVRVGEHTIMAACVGIAGSTSIGSRCAFGGQVGIAGHLDIADDVQVLGTSLVSASIPKPGVYSSALKAEPADEWRRTAARLRQLDELARRLREAEEEIRKLKGE